MSLPTPSFAATYIHICVKCGANICAKLVLGNICSNFAAVCIAVAPDLPVIAYLLSVVVRSAFQAVSCKDVTPFVAGTQFPVRIHLGVVDQAILLFLSFLSSTAFRVVGRLGALAFVGDPCYQWWEWLEEVVNNDRSEEGVEVY